MSVTEMLNDELASMQADMKEIRDRIMESELLFDTVSDALREYTSRHFKPLEKAIEEHGSLDGIHDAYGWDIISKAKYEKLMKLAREKENGVISKFLANFSEEWKRKIKNLNDDYDRLKIRYDSRKAYLDTLQ